MTQDPGVESVTDEPLRAVLDELAQIDQTELDDQAARYERMHATLAETLGSTVERPGAGEH